MNLPRGYIIYRGPSRLNGEPIVVVAIAKSYNSKTGDMAPTYIMPDNGDRPVAAVWNGSDVSVCGDCKHRPRVADTCYVVVRQGPTNVFDSLVAGAYRDMTRYVDIVSEIFSGGMARLGSYGDPAAVPTEVWTEFTRCLSSWVGYTHQWRLRQAQSLRPLCMASVDTLEEMQAAQRMGWRTFRVRLASEPLEHRESACPASAEAGHKLQCAECKSCDGLRSDRKGSIAIVLHGNHPRHRAQRFIEGRRRAEVSA